LPSTLFPSWPFFIRPLCVGTSRGVPTRYRVGVGRVTIKISSTLLARSSRVPGKPFVRPSTCHVRWWTWNLFQGYVTRITTGNWSSHRRRFLFPPRFDFFFFSGAKSRTCVIHKEKSVSQGGWKNNSYC